MSQMSLSSIAVTKVTALPDFVLDLEFNNGERKKVSLAEKIDSDRYFLGISSPGMFSEAYVDFSGAVAWSDTCDIAPSALYLMPEIAHA